MDLIKTYIPNGPLPFNTHFREGNCYSYALGIRDSGRLRPGTLLQSFSQAIEKEQLNVSEIDAHLRKDKLIRIKQHDGEHSKDQILAGFVAPEKDFHFYRLQPNGMWSHKIGSSDPTIYDLSGNRISCPLDANRGKYTDFVGFYRVPKTGIRYIVK